LVNNPDIPKAILYLLANGLLGTEKIIRRNVLVKELTFEGFDVRLYSNIFSLIPGFEMPDEFSGGRFGLYKGVS